MFSKEIVGSDAFQDMPASSQLLYFHLGMEADDDGFIANPKKIARSIGMAEDDMKILIAKRFVLLFQSGVLVIKHHRINNNWDKYNCKRTIYIEEFNQLYIKPNKAYTMDKTQGISVQSENRLKAVFRIEENRREEKRIEEKKEEESQNKNFAPRSLSKKEKQETPMVLNQFVEWCKKSTQRHIQIIGEWAETVKPDLQNRGQWESYIKRHLRAARLLVPFSQEQLERGYEKMMKEKNWLNRYTLETLLKFIC